MNNILDKTPVLIFGLNDLAEMVNYYLKNDSKYNSKYEVVGFTVNNNFIAKLGKATFQGLPVIPFENLNEIYASQYKMIAPVTDNKLRARIYKEAKEMGFKFISYVSEKCSNFSENIGENCFILEDNTIQPFSKIGNNVILWSGNHIGHHSSIDDNVFITSHVVISGHCNIKQGAYLGVNSTIRDGITIGENCIIGMGSLVTKSTEPNKTYVGSPARILGEIKGTLN